MEQSVGGAGQFARIKEGEDHAGHEGERSRSPGRNDGARRNGRLEVEGVGLPHSDVDGGPREGVRLVRVCASPQLYGVRKALVKVAEMIFDVPGHLQR